MPASSIEAGTTPPAQARSRANDTDALIETCVNSHATARREARIELTQAVVRYGDADLGTLLEHNPNRGCDTDGLSGVFVLAQMASKRAGPSAR